MSTASLTIGATATKKRPRQKKVLFPGDDTGKDFTIDEGDYIVVREILSTLYNLDDIRSPNIKTIEDVIREVVGIRENDSERRVFELMRAFHPVRAISIPTCIGRLEKLTHLNLSSLGMALIEIPEEIGDLANLIDMDLGWSAIRSIPRSIGRLKKLENLRLYSTKLLTTLPDEVGDLNSLKLLHLRWSRISSLPDSIGRLQNLEYLDLSRTRLSTLPDHIGELTRLNKLKIEACGIESITPCIGRLQNLNDLNLSSTYNLTKLPEEIGDLTNLKILDLHGSEITSLPSSVGRLRGLTGLYLSVTDKLLTLPEEIGNLTNLKMLDLSESKITSFPDFIRTLTGLMYLYLEDTSICKLKEEDSHNFVLKLVQHCQSLQVLDLEMEKGREKVDYTLACNRARMRTPFGTDEETIRMAPKLWPLMLTNAPRAFDMEVVPQCYDRRARVSSDGGLYCCDSIYSIDKPDAIYQLLVDGRDSFIEILVDRKTKN